MLFALACTGMLAGCSDIEANYKYADEAILKRDGENMDAYNNKLGELYELIAKGQNERVLDEFIKTVIDNEFGSFSELKAAVAGGDTAIDAFVAKHETVYKRSGDDKLVEYSGKSETEISRQRVKDMYADVYKRISKIFYNEITGSTYSEDGVFREKSYAYAKYAELNDVNMKGEGRTFFEGHLSAKIDDKTLSEDDVFNADVLVYANYENYINKKVAYQVMKEKVVEEYILNNYYTTLGRAYARKVKTIKLTSPSDEISLQTKPYAIMKAYADLAIYRKDGDNSITSTLTFENLQNAWRGFKGVKSGQNGIEIVGLDEKEVELLGQAGFMEKQGDAWVAETVTIDGQAVKYYKGTQLGILLEKWKLVEANSVDWDRYPDGEEGSSGKVSSALSLFTGSNSYPKALGLKKEIAKIATNSFTEDGWFAKNGGLTDLPAESLRNRLFNIVVSKNLEQVNENEVARFDTNGDETAAFKEYAKSFRQTENYVRKINGKFYMVPDKYEGNSFAYNMIVIDGSSYYMVEVEEAPSTTLLKTDNASSYAQSDAHKADALFTENVARNIAKILSNKDSYTNKAYVSYIKTYSITYHDQGLLDYFKEKYPELFEQDK